MTRAETLADDFYSATVTAGTWPDGDGSQIHYTDAFMMGAMYQWAVGRLGRTELPNDIMSLVAEAFPLFRASL